jgi:uncharacterized protein YvpB
MRLIRGLLRLLKVAIVVGVFAVIVALLIPVNLNLTEQHQYPTLPNGCEAVSASVALNGMGVPITAESFASQYLPKTAIGAASPEEAYQGDPFGNGYYCYPAPLVTGINNFLATQNTSLEAKTHKLVSVSEIILRLHADKPVIVWSTVDDHLAKRERTIVWQNDGDEYHPYTNLHVMVIDGIKGGKVHLVDSVNGSRWMSLFKFIPLYYSMGLRAVYFTD